MQIAENDELPHKICFRCSAKVEELHEFVQKCIKTQENLCSVLGKKGPLITKAKTQRHLWEEKLNKSNISNDDICNAVIKKAMESINIPLKLPIEEEKTLPEQKTTPKRTLIENVVKPAPEVPVKTPVQKKTKNVDRKKKCESKELSLKPEKQNTEDSIKTEEMSDVSIKPVSLNMIKCDQKMLPARLSRSKPSESLEGSEDKSINTRKSTILKDSPYHMNDNIAAPINVPATINTFSIDEGPAHKQPKTESGIAVQEGGITKTEEKPFNIMDHISIIKVNGVGVLFQCRMCNRNFLKKDVVASHGCAKNIKNVTKSVAAPEPPKPPKVKYLNIKLDEDTKKKTVTESKSISDDTQETKKTESNTDTNVKKYKPKIGPASKVRREVNDVSRPAIGMVVSPREPTPPPPVKPNIVTPSVQFPAIPSLNSRYKLVPGPNNTFTLVEEHNNQNQESTVPAANDKALKKRKSTPGTSDSKVGTPKMRKQGSLAISTNIGNTTLSQPNSDIIDLETSTPSEEASVSQPYPVGLFKTVPHHASLYPPEVTPEPAIFTTPAMKKQSYTVVQTGNPSKLLISSKPQPPVVEVPKKRQKKTKVAQAAREDPVVKQPFSVTLEDAAPPKDSGFFTFINVDPLLQPSYVLPTDNIIQESQISTSTPLGRVAQESNDKEKYTCNMCDEKFTREKKLLAHIHSHYSKMDEEDQLRSEKTTRKRGRKS